MRGRGVVQETEIGGAVCPALEEEEPCNTDQCPGSVDCKVEDWSSWSKCRVICTNSGARTSKSRSRGVAQEAKNGGAACPELVEEDTCDANECKGKHLFIIFCINISTLLVNKNPPTLFR